MNTIMKTVLTGLVCAGIGTAAWSVYAHEAGCPDKAAQRGYHHDQGWYMKQMEQRNTELHDKLKLTPEQEAAWTAFTGKMKPVLPGQRPDWTEFSKLPAPERMSKMVEIMKGHEAQMENHVAAVKDFYATLTPEQQKVFDEGFSFRFGHHAGMWRQRHHGPGNGSDATSKDG